MQYAARHHIVSFVNKNPGYADSMSQRLAEILQRFKDDWDALERELRKFIEQLRVGDRNEFPELDPQSQVPFVRVLLKEIRNCARDSKVTDKDAVDPDGARRCRDGQDGGSQRSASGEIRPLARGLPSARCRRS
jgi:hypothetical protein